MDFLIRDCILCFTKKDEKNDFFLVYSFFLLLSTLEINHCS